MQQNRGVAYNYGSVRNPFPKCVGFRPNIVRACYRRLPYCIDASSFLHFRAEFLFISNTSDIENEDKDSPPSPLSNPDSSINGGA